MNSEPQPGASSDLQVTLGKGVSNGEAEGGMDWANTAVAVGVGKRPWEQEPGLTQTWGLKDMGLVCFPKVVP